MPLYDSYEQYRPAPNPRQQALIDEAEAQSAELAQQQTGPRVTGGYEGPSGFVEDPLVTAHMALAKEQAAEQLQKLPVMPEDDGIALRFAELDPIGKYSLIDMRFSHRYHLIQAALQTRSRNIQHCFAQLQQQMKKSAAFLALHAQMRQAAEAHRLLSRASKLCWHPEGRELLHQQTRALESNPAVVRYDLLMQGMEYLAGIVPMLSPEVEQLYREMKLPLPSAPATDHEKPDSLRVNFQNFDNQMLQHWYASPENWGADPNPKPDYQPNTVCAAVQYYAIATVRCALKPVLAHARSIGLHPVDLILINGVSLREALDPEGNSDLNSPQVDAQATAALAAALISGRKVDILLPDDHGNLSNDPIPVTAEGYVLEQRNKIIRDAWTLFVSRQSVYFSRHLNPELPGRRSSHLP